MDTIKRRGTGASSRAAAPAAPSPPAPIRPDWWLAAIERGPRWPRAERGGADGAVRRDAAGGRSRRSARRADELRAELAGETVTFVVNRNINISNVCTVGCAFCGFGQGKRSPDAYEHDEQEFWAADPRGDRSSARPSCASSRASTRTGASRTTSGWLRLAKATARRSCTCTRTRRWRSRTCATSSGLEPAEVFARLRDAGLGSTPGTAAEVLHDGVRERISPNKLPVAAGCRSSRPRTRPACARPPRSCSATSRSRGSWPSTCASIARAAGAHGRDHRVRAAVIHPLPDAARPHPRDRGDLARGEPQAHRRLPPGARSHRSPNLQASWVKMGLDAATESCAGA